MSQRVIDFYAGQLYRAARRVIVCGSRSFHRKHRHLIELELGSLHQDCVIVHGGQGKYTRTICQRCGGPRLDEYFCRLCRECNGIGSIRVLESGADMLADEVAKDRGLRTELHPAEWMKYGKKAGYLRNKKMVDLGADFTIAFWDGKSNGTHNTLELSREASIPCRIVPFDP